MKLAYGTQVALKLEIGKCRKHRRGDLQSLSFLHSPYAFGSWFPGYSWTIASCRFCRSHLGWKFLRVQDEATTPPPSHPSENEPLMFFGMSAGNVKTMHVCQAVVLGG